MTTIELAELDHIHGGAQRTPSGPGLTGLGGLGALQTSLQQPSTNDRMRYLPGMSYHMEYPNGFKPNGDAKSWQSVDNASGRVLYSGDNK